MTKKLKKKANAKRAKKAVSKAKPKKSKAVPKPKTEPQVEKSTVPVETKPPTEPKPVKLPTYERCKVVKILDKGHTKTHFHCAVVDRSGNKLTMHIHRSLL